MTFILEARRIFVSTLVTGEQTAELGVRNAMHALVYNTKHRNISPDAERREIVLQEPFDHRYIDFLQEARLALVQLVEH